MTHTPYLVRSDAGGIATLLLNRPESRNALSQAMLQALVVELESIGADSAVRVVVLAGAGPAFCAGHDLKEIRAANFDCGFTRELFAECARVMLAIVKLPKPVIAQVHGVATAAGCQLVASCDLAIALTTPASRRPGSTSAFSVPRPWWPCRAMSAAKPP